MVVLAIVADRGLSGPYNSSVLRATERLVAELGRDGTEVRLFSVGKKAASYFRFRGQPVERAFIGMSDRPTFADAREVASVVASPFVAGEVDQVLLVSTRYRSAGSQVVEARQLLPLPDPAADAGRPGGGGAGTPSSSRTSSPSWPSWHPRRSSPRSSPPSWRVRPRSSPPSSGPWRRPPTTPTTSSPR